MATMTAKKVKIRPLDDRVVVKPSDPEEVTAGGIVLPDSAREKPQRGTVMAVGPGKLLDSGERGTRNASGAGCAEGKVGAGLRRSTRAARNRIGDRGAIRLHGEWSGPPRPRPAGSTALRRIVAGRVPDRHLPGRDRRPGRLQAPRRVGLGEGGARVRVHRPQGMRRRRFDGKRSAGSRRCRRDR